MEKQPSQLASRSMTSCKRPSVKMWFTRVVILLVVLLILSITGSKVCKKVKREKNITGDGEATPSTSVHEYDVM